MFHKLYFLYLTLIVLLQATVLIAEGSLDISRTNKPTVKWGIVLPLSGSLSRAGVEIRRGFELALSEHSSDSKFSHELIFEDSQYQSKFAVTATHKLIHQDKVDLIVGLWDTADPIAPLTDRYEKLHTSIRWNSNIANQFKNTFTFESTYKSYVKMFLQSFKRQGFKTVVILGEESTSWNLVFDEFQKQHKAYDIKILDSIPYLPNTSDYSTLAIKAIKQKPDIIIINDIAETLELITAKIKSISPTQTVTGYLGYEIKNTSLFEGQHYIEQMILSPEFEKLYKSKYSEPIFIRPQMAYDLFKIVASAYEEFTEKPSTSQIVEELKRPKEYTGASGRIINTEGGKVFETECVERVIRNGKKVAVYPENK